MSPVPTAARAACRCSARLRAAAPLLSYAYVWDAKCPSLHRGGARLPGWSASRHLPLPLLTVGSRSRARDLSPSPLGSVRLLRSMQGFRIPPRRQCGLRSAPGLDRSGTRRGRETRAHCGG
ncbi:hypothetical protein NDU88_002882 [Pleurodeles waltl]|uniref:Uncharacterized protein n=1 Tax=Pleurodeles waltl TaxID=8319 RepID=A0AAV7NJ59_PLEWA|nr:hypothetical protein NDU88_002882 [Pleurodeles waltl]